MIDDASKNATHIYYKSVQQADGILTFTLEQNSFFDEEFNRETLFIIEKPATNKKKSQLLEVGTFVEFQNSGTVLAVKASPRHPALPQKGSISVDYRREIQQYRRQEAALEDFRHSETVNTGNLKSIFVGVDEPGRIPLGQVPRCFNQQLDLTQKRAVRKILEAEDITLIQGPPGTGKTNVLVEAVRQILHENAQNTALRQKILIVSQSHAAVDKILEDLQPFLDNVTTIRIGSEEKIAEEINTMFGLNHCQASWAGKSVALCKERLGDRLAEKDISLETFLDYSQCIEGLQIGNISAKEKSKLEHDTASFERTHALRRDMPYLQALCEGDF